VVYEPPFLYSSSATCIWTDKHFSTQGKKKYNYYAQNIRHHFTKIQLAGQPGTLDMCTPVSYSGTQWWHHQNPFQNSVFKKNALIIRLNVPMQMPTFSIVTVANDIWGFMIFQTEQYNRHTIASILTNETCYMMVLIYSFTGVTQELVIFTHTAQVTSNSSIYTVRLMASFIEPSLLTLANHVDEMKHQYGEPPIFHYTHSVMSYHYHTHKV
jgi:hypothetical protein